MKIFICIISVLLFSILVPASFAASEDRVKLEIVESPKKVISRYLGYGTGFRIWSNS